LRESGRNYFGQVRHRSHRAPKKLREFGALAGLAPGGLLEVAGDRAPETPSAPNLPEGMCPKEKYVAKVLFIETRTFLVSNFCWPKLC
jgi:hypothetical protein